MGRVQLLLRQHVGAPCAPCVEVGAEVKKGDDDERFLKEFKRIHKEFTKKSLDKA